MPESNTDITDAQIDTNTNSNPVDFIQAPDIREISRSLNPLVHVSFTGNKKLYAYGRIALYASLAYVSYRKARKLSYAFMGAAAMSTATSLSRPVV